MCDIRGKLDGKIVLGYKVAILIDGKYHSPSTGIEYKVGEIEIPNWDDLRFDGIFLRAPAPFRTSLYDERHKGCTQIFKSYEGAEELCKTLYMNVCGYTTQRRVLYKTWNKLKCDEFQICTLELTGPGFWIGSYEANPTRLIGRIDNINFLSEEYSFKKIK